MAQSFSYYLNSVRLWVNDLTDGVIDLDDLPDVVDIGEYYADELTARECALEILDQNGYNTFEFPVD